MAKTHGKKALTLLNGYNISSYLKDFKFNGSRDSAKTSCFRQNSESYLSGMNDGTFTAGGLFDGAASEADEILSAAFNNVADNNLVHIPGGNAIGKSGRAMDCIKTAYDISVTVDDAASISAAGQSNVGVERVTVLHNLVAEAIDAEGAYRDLGAAGANGGAAYIQATAVGDTLDVVVEHSADHLAWNTLCTFAQLTALGSERVAFAGAVNRYVRVVTDVGALASTFLVAINIK